MLLIHDNRKFTKRAFYRLHDTKEGGKNVNIKVSVIIPIYKVEQYIRRCIDSAIAQTHRNLEIILVDDGSPDNCPQICDDYAKLDQRIKVIHKSNGGLSDARNAGLKVFTGDYVYFFDGDDYIESNLIEIALHNAVVTSADLVVFNYDRVDENDNLLAISNFKTGIYQIEDHNRVDYIVNNLAKYTSGWEAWNRLFKSDIIRKYNLLFWDNKLIFAEDFGFSLNFALHVKKITCISEVLYHYLIRENSIMSQAAKDPRLSASIALSKLVEEKITNSFRNSILYKEFPILFYSIMYEQLRGVTKDNYKKSISSINDKEYFYKNLKRVTRRPISILKHYGGVRGFVVLLICIILITRKFDNLNVRIIESYKKRWKISEVFENNKAKMFSKRRIFVIGTEDFKDLKDHHIAISEMEYLQNTFPDYSIIEITASEYLTVRHMLSFIIKNRDLICIPGGGNMENVNSLAECIRGDVMKKYRNNRKVIFPQTIHYDSSEDGILQLIRDQSFIKKCKNVTLCVREQSSYELAKQYFECNVVMIPDILLYSNYNKRFCFERMGAVLLLHNDIEGALSRQDKLLIGSVVQQYIKNIQFNDTILNSNISVFDRKEVITSFVKKIAKAKMVVTDHLHGMLFCVITQTPCIVLPDYKEKIEEVYEWVSKLGYIKMISNVSELDEAVQEFSRIKNIEYDNSGIMEGFDVLTKILQEETAR
ncbi:MAG: glycosyl transferase family 2 [Herbinix sp.]|jgi:exopolysaccharide biosynthesis predicted pyruvyltransferase EpsI|nr:glycosyl transferase family 2 [Herbinix sp.]